ncbi:MAG: ABC transporter permease [Eubacteriales bacterium]|nr:ABC transporter permease [Eubacteriales bacterium]
MMAYFATLDPMTLVRALPGNVAQGLIWGIMALGVYITFRILDFPDLTVDGTLATGGAVAVMMIQGGMHPALVLIFATLAGMLAGIVTGLLHTALGIPGILASILTQISLYSVNLGIMGKANQSIGIGQKGLVASLRFVSADDSYLFFIKLILICLVLVAIVYWMFGTEIGSAIRATGCNEQMARAQGINTNFTKVIALMISNGLVGLCGGIYAQYQGSADVNSGRGAIVIGLAAVIISEVIFGRLCAGRKLAFAYTLAAVFVGAILYYIAYTLVLWLKMPSDYMKLFSAIVVAIFLAIPYLKDKHSTKRRRA